MYKKYINPNASSRILLKVSRTLMIAMAVIGTVIALLQPKLLWVFLIYGALASAALFPTIFSLYWDRLEKNAAFLAVALSLVIGLPLSIYANVVENVNLIVLAAVLSATIGLVVCLVGGFMNTKRYKFEVYEKE